MHWARLSRANAYQSKSYLVIGVYFPGPNLLHGLGTGLGVSPCAKVYFLICGYVGSSYLAIGAKDQIWTTGLKALPKYNLMEVELGQAPIGLAYECCRW